MIDTIVFSVVSTTRPRAKHDVKVPGGRRSFGAALTCR